MVKSKFSRTWKSSLQPNKQRKYVFKAPDHIRKKFLSTSLSKELKKKYNKRSLVARTGDKVKILRGTFKGKIGKVERVDSRRAKIYIGGVELIKKDGTKALSPVHASNLEIVELLLDDKKRIDKLKQDKPNKRHNNGKESS